MHFLFHGSLENIFPSFNLLISTQDPAQLQLHKTTAKIVFALLFALYLDKEWSKSEREKTILYISAYKWNLEKW